MGASGSGKSTFIREYLASSHTRINNDTIKNAKKAQKLCSEHLLNGKNIVVDNLNANQKARQVYIELAQEAKIEIIKCLVFETDKE